ncbi:MAG: polysaccharide biosynthesis/export family protein [bacterium]
MIRLINQGRLRPLIQSFCLFTFIGLLQISPLNAKPQRSSQTFKRGDALRLMVWQPYRISDGKNQSIDLNGEYAIDNRGSVFFPLVGEVKVVGYTSTTLAEQLKDKFSPFLEEPVIVVEPLIRVVMLGAFRRPGTYLIEPDASLWQLVDKAGGPRDDSNLKKMWVERGGRVVKKNILSGFERAYSLKEIGVSSGDQVVVPEKKKFRLKDALEILRFGVTIINIYFLVDRIGKT